MTTSQLSPTEWAAWIQAVGSVGAILVSGGIVWWQHHLDNVRYESRRSSETRELLAFLKQSFTWILLDTEGVRQHLSPGQGWQVDDLLKEPYFFNRWNRLTSTVRQVPVRSLIDDGVWVSYSEALDCVDEIERVLRELKLYRDGASAERPNEDDLPRFAGALHVPLEKFRKSKQHFEIRLQRLGAR